MNFAGCETRKKTKRMETAKVAAVAGVGCLNAETRKREKQMVLLVLEMLPQVSSYRKTMVSKSSIFLLQAPLPLLLLLAER